MRTLSQLELVAVAARQARWAAWKVANPNATPDERDEAWQAMDIADAKEIDALEEEDRGLS